MPTVTRKPKLVSRKVIYPEFEALICHGSNLLTAEPAKEMLGWKLETKDEPFGDDFLLKDTRGKKVRCSNNMNNRPLYPGTIATLTQEIIRGKWQLNGEPVILGRTGQILDGQHTLLSVVLATQVWEDNHAEVCEWWPKKAPGIAKVIVRGIDENDSVVNTINTAKPRTLTDVVYRSGYFKNIAASHRQRISSIVDKSMRVLWRRLQLDHDTFLEANLRRTHAESLAFIERHPRLLEASKHIFEQDGSKGRIKTLYSVGNATAMLYLMASCASNNESDDSYHNLDSPSEAAMDFKTWDEAKGFWKYFAESHKDFTNLRVRLKELAAEAALAERAVNPYERDSIVIQAWNIWNSGEPIEMDTLDLDWITDDAGDKVLGELPTVGGIDLGPIRS